MCVLITGRNAYDDAGLGAQRAWPRACRRRCSASTLSFILPPISGAAFAARRPSLLNSANGARAPLPKRGAQRMPVLAVWRHHGHDRRGLEGFTTVTSSGGRRRRPGRPRAQRLDAKDPDRFCMSRAPTSPSTSPRRWPATAVQRFALYEAREETRCRLGARRWKRRALNVATFSLLAAPPLCQAWSTRRLSLTDTLQSVTASPSSPAALEPLADLPFQGRGGGGATHSPSRADEIDRLAEASVQGKRA